ncbi:MAG TPA: hypothetical protein VD995_30970 [Azospirillum sp.]|nr:hypothetical protein [Azospirillum sp.]
MTTDAPPPHPWMNRDVLKLLARWLGESADDAHFAQRVKVNARFQRKWFLWLATMFISTLSVSATSGLDGLPMVGLVAMMAILAHGGPPERSASFSSVFVVVLGTAIGWIVSNGSDLQWLQYVLLVPFFLAVLGARPLGRQPGDGTARRVLYRVSVAVNAAWIWIQFLEAVLWARLSRVRNEWAAWAKDRGVGPGDWDVEFDCPHCVERKQGELPGRLRTWPTLKHPRWVLCDLCGKLYRTTEPVSPEAVRTGVRRRLAKRRRTRPRVLFVMLDPRRRGEIARAFRIEPRYVPADGSTPRMAGELPAPGGAAVPAMMPFHDPGKGTVWAGDFDAVVAVVPAAAPANHGADRWNDVEVALSSVECPFDTMPLRGAATLTRWQWLVQALRLVFTPARRRAADWWEGTPPVLAVWMPDGRILGGPPEHRGHAVVRLHAPGDLYRALSESADALRVDDPPRTTAATDTCLTA